MLARMTTKFTNRPGFIRKLPFAFNFVFICLLILSSCSKRPEIERHFDTYAQRLTNVLEAELPAIQTSPLKFTIPSKDNPTSSPQSTQVTLREFYDLPSCDTVKSLIAERNTSLGRVQDESMQFLYHNQLINMLNKCLNSQQNEHSKNAIHKLIEVKKLDLVDSWNNLLLHSSEIKKALSGNGIYMTKTLSVNQQAIADYRNLLSIQRKIQNTPELINALDLHQTFRSIAKNRLPSRLWNSLYLYNTRLKALNELLKQQPSLHCDTPKSKQKIEYLNNVFQLFFVGKIQPLAARLNKMHYNLSPNLLALYAEGSVPRVYTDYIHYQSTILFQTYQEAIKEHVKIWQKIFDNCQVKPGMNLST